MKDEAPIYRLYLGKEYIDNSTSIDELTAEAILLKKINNDKRRAVIERYNTPILEIREPTTATDFKGNVEVKS